MQRLALVYQAGIANVFEVNRFGIKPEERGKTRRLYQGDFHTAKTFVRGAEHAGARVGTYACNRAGDIINAPWDTTDENAPFLDHERGDAANAVGLWLGARS